MNALTLGAAMAAAVTAYVGLYHFWLHVRRPSRSDFLFALTCACMTFYDVGAALLYNAEQAGDGEFWQRLQIAAIMALAMPFLLLINEQSGIIAGPGIGRSLFVLPLSAVITAVEPFGWVIGSSFDSKAVNTPFGTYVIHESGVGPLYHVFEAIVPFMLVYCGWAGLGAPRYRSGKWHKRGAGSAPLLFASVALLGTTLHDIGVNRSYIHHPFLMEYGWLGVMVVMSLRLSNEVFDAFLTREALEVTERRERTTLNAIQDAVVTTDMLGRITHLNPAAEKLLGVKSAEASLRPLSQFVEITADGVGIVSDPVRFALGRPPNPYGSLPQLVTRDGHERRVDLGGAPLKDPEGHVHGAIVVLRDLTLQHNALSSLDHAKKMESLGQLAGGTAHDLNNLLTPIISYVELVQRSLRPGSKETLYLEHVQDAAQRAARLTKQLLALSRKQVLDVQTVSLTELVRQTVPMIERMVGDGIRVLTDLDENAGRVRVDPGQFEQVLLNLASNARDALEHGGELRVITRRIGNGECSLEIIDNGTGMDEKTAAQIFEPFFTTKPRGKGTGLGLASVRGIVEQHGGAIYVDSDAGVGTSFEIVLPTNEEEAPASSSPVGAPGNLVRGTEHILVVEDDRSVRELIRDALAELGYTVHLADGLAMAEELARSEPVEALLTDVVLPGADGPRIRDAVLAHKKIPCLFMTGHADDRLGDRGIVPRGTEVLRKPFTVAELGRRLRQVIDADKRKQKPKAAPAAPAP